MIGYTLIGRGFYDKSGSYHSKGDVPMNFGAAERARFKEMIVPIFGDFLKKCYSKCLHRQSIHVLTIQQVLRTVRLELSKSWTVLRRFRRWGWRVCSWTPYANLWPRYPIMPQSLSLPTLQLRQLVQRFRPKAHENMPNLVSRCRSLCNRR